MTTSEIPTIKAVAELPRFADRTAYTMARAGKLPGGPVVGSAGAREGEA